MAATQRGADRVEGADWSARLLAGAPLIAPARAYTFPFHVPGEEEALSRGALWIEAKSPSGSFGAQCALGFATAGVAHGLWPMGERLIAVAGGYAYVLDVLHPERTELLALRPVVAVWTDDRRAVLVGYHGVLVLDGDERWMSPRLSWEGVTVTGVEGDTLHGTGWDMQTDEEVPFTLNLQTRALQGGGYRTVSPGERTA